MKYFIFRKGKCDKITVNKKVEVNTSTFKLVAGAGLEPTTFGL